jgi:hypothetical protein
MLTYALGRGVEHEDMPVVRSIVRDSAREDYRLSSIVMNIVKSAPFQINRVPLTTVGAVYDRPFGGHRPPLQRKGE